MTARPRQLKPARDGTPRWELRFEIPPDPVTGERRQRSKTFRGGRRAAEKELARLITEASKAAAPGSDQTFGWACDQFLEHRIMAGRAAHTIAGYRSKIGIIHTDEVAAVGLGKLSTTDLHRFYRRRLEAGNSANGVRAYHRLIVAVLNFAFRADWVDRNVALRAEPPRAERHEKRIPTEDEIRRLIDAAIDGIPAPDKGKKAAMRPEPGRAILLQLCMVTGLRRGEVCGLRWCDIDWAQRRIVLDGALFEVTTPEPEPLPGAFWVWPQPKGGGWRQLGRKPTKNTRPRTITIGPLPVGLLVALRAEAIRTATHLGRTLSDDAYLFAAAGWEDGSRPVPPSIVSEWVRRLRSRVDPPVPDFHLHVLRHWSTTKLLAAGIDVRSIAARLGHQDGGTLVLQRYGHAEDPVDVAAAAALDEALAAIDAAARPRPIDVTPVA